MNNTHDLLPDEQLNDALGPAAVPDFDRWQAEHPDAVAYLNPVVTELTRRKRKRWIRMTNAVVAATILVALASWWIASPESSFAETVEAIANARSATWTITSYERAHSKDGKRTWVRTSRGEFLYRHPGLFRLNSYDHKGQLTKVEIEDAVNHKSMTWNMLNKTYQNATPGLQVAFDGRGPFGWVNEVLSKRTIELVGKRTLKDGEASVIRYRRPAMRDPERNSLDFWIDVQTKRLVGISDPGANAFDPETLPDRNHPAEEEFSKMSIIGSVNENIVFDANVDPAEFTLKAPEGFKLVEAAQPAAITEADLVEWYRVVAKVNNNTFADSLRATDTERIWTALRTEPAERNKLEKELGDVWLKNFKKGNQNLTLGFRSRHTEEGSFRYVGKGVKLGDDTRIVCWYRLKETDKYRAIYGDLSIRDVDENDLPIAVE